MREKGNRAIGQYGNIIPSFHHSVILSFLFLFLINTSDVSAQRRRRKPDASLSSHAAGAPKLVVGIIVDQMRYDYIQKYWDKFGNDGFKKLVNEGYNCKNTNYNYVPTFTGPGHASVYTGATPATHGIVANEWFNDSTKKKVYCVQDGSVQSVGGTGNSGQMSPKNLLTSTPGEELLKIFPGKSKVVGIALKDRGAILPAGHHPTAAYWYEGGTGNWITSTYYMKELPKWVGDFNKKESPKKYLSQPWVTLLPIEQYTESDADDNTCEEPFKGKEKPVFPYDLSALMKLNGNLGFIRSTPFGNTLTKDFAMEVIKNENMGKDEFPDMLCVSFSSTDYIGHQFGPQSVEVEDCYLRLDKDLAELLQFLDQWAGKKNVLVFLTADHGAGEAVPCLQKKGVDAGVVHEKIIADSLKRFFQRSYGDSALLMQVVDYNIYLDKNKIIAKGLDHESVQAGTCQYLRTVNGISTAFSGIRLVTEYDIKFPDTLELTVKAGYYHGRSGDVIYVLKPNWLEGYPKGTTHGSPYSYDTHVPLLWWGWKIKQGSSEQKLAITQIAPTVCNMLDVLPPTGSASSDLMIIKSLRK